MIENCLYIYVDDDRDDLDIFEMVMHDLNGEMKAFENPLEAIETLGNINRLPCIIFLDLNMPVMNGLAVLKALRENPRLASVPIVIYSTSDSKKNIDAAWTSGADLYVPKPSSVKAVKKVLQYALSVDWNKHIRRRENFVVAA